MISNIITGCIKVYFLDNYEVPYSGLFITERQRDNTLSLKDAEKILTSEDFFGKELITIIPDIIKNALRQLSEQSNKDQYSLQHGTFFIISGLRDKWTEQEKQRINDVLGYLIPPNDQDNYEIIIQVNPETKAEKVENNALEDYDYKIQARFDGDKFCIQIHRNEFDLNIMPKGLFRQKELEDLLPHAGESVRIDDRILELDTLLEKSICGKGVFQFL